MLIIYTDNATIFDLWNSKFVYKRFSFYFVCLLFTVLLE